MITTMFFKRKVRVPPVWWTRMNEVQYKYARRMASGVGRRVARIPMRRLRLYVVLYVAAMAGLNVAGVWHALRQGGGRTPALMSGPDRVVIPMPHWPMDPEDYRRLMGRVPVGDKAMDSLEKVRPGLADSLRVLEGGN